MDNLKLELLSNGFTYKTYFNGDVFLVKTFNVQDLPLFIEQFQSDEPDQPLPSKVVLELSECGGVLQYCVVCEEDIDYYLSVKPLSDIDTTKRILTMFGLQEV